MKKSRGYEFFDCKLKKDIAEKLNQMSEETGMSKTATVEKAIQTYYEQYKRTVKV